VQQNHIGRFGDEKNLQLLTEIEKGFLGGPTLGPVTTSLRYPDSLRSYVLREVS
jgi:hypothetical protein